jgi:hypothetical protein
MLQMVGPLHIQRTRIVRIIFKVVLTSFIGSLCILGKDLLVVVKETVQRELLDRPSWCSFFIMVKVKIFLRSCITLKRFD